MMCPFFIKAFAEHLGENGSSYYCMYNNIMLKESVVEFIKYQ